MQNKSYRHLHLILGLFIAFLLTANLLSSAKIVDLGVALLGLPLIFDAGLLIFPLCYVFGDVLTEVYGYRVSRRVIWTGFAANLTLTVFVRLAGAMPGESGWQEFAGKEAFDAILGGMAGGGILIASLTAYLVGEFSNSFILAKMKVMTGGKFFFGRAMSSTLVGQLLDTAIFILIAYAFGVFDGGIVLELIYTNYLFKLLIEFCLFPLTYWLVDFLKRSEGEDYFDKDTDFNPFGSAKEVAH